jgi:hypothetical protein
MSYAETTQARLFLTTPFKLSVFPGLWILSTDDAASYQVISFSSCSYPSIYLSSGICYWYRSSADGCVAINWALCTGPIGALPPFPWGSLVPTYPQLIQYLYDNRQPGSCEGSGSGTMANIYNSNGLLTGTRVVDQGTHPLTFHPSSPGSFFSVSREGGLFPPTQPNALAWVYQPDDFLGTGKPGFVFGYQPTPGVSGGDSAALQISEVTGQKAILVTSINEASSIQNTFIMNDNETRLEMNTPGTTANIVVTPGQVTTTADDIKLQALNNITLEANNSLVLESLDTGTAGDILYFNPLTGVVTHDPPPASTPNVIKTNVGVGTSMFASTVTNDTVSLKTLVDSPTCLWGSGPSQVTATALSIYNSNQSLNSARTVTLANFPLTFFSAGTGSFNVNIVNNINFTGAQFNVNSPSVTLNGIPNAVGPTQLYYDPMTKQVSYA